MLQDRLKTIRNLLHRNGYLLERSKDESTRIVHARDVVEDSLIRERARIEKNADQDESTRGEYNSVLADLGILGQ